MHGYSSRLISSAVFASANSYNFREKAQPFYAKNTKRGEIAC